MAGGIQSALGDDERYTASPPAAKQIHEAEPNNPGWGGEASEYEGEYELTNGGNDPTEKAGTLGAVIGVAQGLGVNGALVSSGSMTVAGNPAVATVELETGGTSRTFTLTKLAWQGDERVAPGPRRRGDQPTRRPLRRHRWPG